jgi:hypothetical protein
MDLAIDKSTQLNILPRTKYELYQSILRLPEPPIKQMGVPISMEKRDMEINTDEIIMVDKEMQFSYGDDTALFNTINEIRRKKDHTSIGSDNSQRVATNYMENATSFDSDSFESNVRGAAKLTAFLNCSAYLFESSLPAASGGEEKSNERSSSSSSSSKGNAFSVFAPDSSWITLGGDKANGANELISTRRAVSLRFSGMNSNLIVAAYKFPPPEEDPELDMDLKPFKVFIVNIITVMIELTEYFSGFVLHLGLEQPRRTNIYFGSRWATHMLLFFWLATPHRDSWYSGRVLASLGPAREQFRTSRQVTLCFSPISYFAKCVKV